MVPESDFAFAFNNASFSDRLLRIEITGGSGEVSNSSIVDWDRDRKRRRLDDDELDNVKSEFNNDKMHEEAQCGYEDDNASCSKLMTSPLVLRVKELHLFSNGMLESEQRQVTLNVDASEEAAVMEVLNFIYSNSLSVTTVPAALLDVLMAADKFEVASCIDYCTRLLLNMPMTVDLALLLLDLPPSVVATDSVKPLTNAARQFIASHYKDLHKNPLEEVLALPLVGIEALLASDDLEIISEEILYDTVLKWAKTHYTGLEERQEILGSRLANYIRFPHMSCSKLRKILTSNDFRPHVASSLVLEALFLKAESMLRQPTLPSERAYKYRPIQIMRFEVPRQQCMVYLDIKHKECVGIYPNGRVLSQTFYIGGHSFALSVQCNLVQFNNGQPASFCCFGLICMTGKEPVSLSMDYEFAVRSKPTNTFVGKCKGEYNFTGGKSVGHRNLFMTPWETCIATDSPYFISDVLNLRAVLSIRL